MSTFARKGPVMGPFTRRKASAALAVALAAVALATAPQPAGAAVVGINLCALPGTTAPLPLTDPTATVPIWGFATTASPGNCSGLAATLPGPVLTATVGDEVTITVTNALDPGRVLSLDIPGVSFTPTADPTEVAPGAVLTRTFTANAPGTFIYQSAGDAGRQAAMGLYGLLVVRPTTPGIAYGATTGYDQEALLLLSVVDPSFNTAPLTADLHAYRATWWLINGRAYPDTVPVSGAGGQRVLLRYANAGFDQTSMQLLGLHERVIARDAYPLSSPQDVAVETIPAGATKDSIVTVPTAATVTPPSTHGFPLYNRQLHLTNGGQSGLGPTPATGGGMLTFLAQ